MIFRSSFRLFGRNSYQLFTKIMHKEKIIEGYHGMLSIQSNPTVIPKKFCLDDYDAIGFDLDNTLALYNLRNLLPMIYVCLAQYLVKEKGYDKILLEQSINDANAIDFMQKGLFVDSKRGNLLKIDSEGKIRKACHGLKFLTTNDIKKTYGEDLKWNVTNEFVKDFLSTWNGDLSEQMRPFLDYYDTPASLVFARAVESIDKKNLGVYLPCYDVYSDILQGLIYMFTPSQFVNNEGMFFPEIKQNTERYYHKTPDHVLQWLKDLRSKGKVLFLLTGSYADYASHTATTCLGKNWEQYFDHIGFFSKKPGFFTGVNRPFLKFKDDKVIPESSLNVEKKFNQGNWNGLMSAMKKSLNKSDFKTLYIGDNFIQDLYTPSKYISCDTIAICEEQSAEQLFGAKLHSNEIYLKSNIWDSYFYFTETDKKIPTVWSDILKKYSKICVPSISYLASNPIDKEYTPFNKEHIGFNKDGFHS